MLDATKVNAEFRIFDANDAEFDWGSRTAESGNWTGLVGQLIAGQFDLIAITYPRNVFNADDERLLHILHPVVTSNLYLIKQRVVDIPWENAIAFWNVFSNGLWMAFLVLMMFIVVTMALISLYFTGRTWSVWHLLGSVKTQCWHFLSFLLAQCDSDSTERSHVALRMVVCAFL